MATNGQLKIVWKADVDPHDFDAALNYLTLLLDRKRAKALVRKLRAAPVTFRRANDLLRASNRVPLTLADPGVRRDHVKVLDGAKLSPILVVSFDFGCDFADGFHRASLSYNFDPFGSVPLRLAAI
jgi:hypothetical protein